MNAEHTSAVHQQGVSVSKAAEAAHAAHAEGTYTVVCLDANGVEKWADKIENIVVNVGKNLALDTLFSGSAYTVTGPFMGLANSGVASAVVGDTMASKTGWLEVGATNAPAYTGARKTVTFAAASAGSKASTGTYTFAITSSGTVGGCFIVLGTGAVSTVDSTAGVLYSVGAFSGGSRAVVNGDSLTVTYTASL